MTLVDDIKIFFQFMEDNWETLIYHKDSDIRCALAEWGYGWDVLVYDENVDVRITLAHNGHGVKILIDDEDSDVRWHTVYWNYGYDKLINDEDIEIRNLVMDYVYEQGYDSIQEWINEHPNSLYYKDFQKIDKLKDFIYKIEGSNKLKVQCDECDNIKEFFNNSINELKIITVDTKLPIITLAKENKDNKLVYKFIVNIIVDEYNEFNIKTLFTSNEQFIKLIESTINSLKEYPQFSKYADELENCL